jgi:hypothetical protein
MQAGDDLLELRFGSQRLQDWIEGREQSQGGSLFKAALQKMDRLPAIA